MYTYIIIVDRGYMRAKNMTKYLSKKCVHPKIFIYLLLSVMRSMLASLQD